MSPKPGDWDYEEYRFELNEQMARLSKRELIAVCNNLIDQIEEVEEYVVDEEELQEILITTKGEEENE
jgi:Ser-tRNA(Ala) deacylase AlaX